MKGLTYIPSLQECLMMSTAEMMIYRMLPTRIHYDILPEGDLIRLAFANSNGSVIPSKGTYSIEPSRFIEIPRAQKAAKYVFKINKNGWCGLQVYTTAGDCIVNLEGRNSTTMI